MFSKHSRDHIYGIVFVERNMLRLIIIDDEGQKIAVPFIRNEIRIGRKKGNTIRLMERNISRNHASLSRDDDNVWIEDLDSYNGVFLNGNRIGRRTAMYPGDVAVIGDYSMRLEREERLRPKIELDPELDEEHYADAEPLVEPESITPVSLTDHTFVSVEDEPAKPTEAPEAQIPEDTAAVPESVSDDGSSPEPVPEDFPEPVLHEGFKATAEASPEKVPEGETEVAPVERKPHAPENQAPKIIIDSEAAIKENEPKVARPERSGYIEKEDDRDWYEIKDSKNPIIVGIAVMVLALGAYLAYEADKVGKDERVEPSLVEIPLDAGAERPAEVMAASESDRKAREKVAITLEEKKRRLDEAAENAREEEDQIAGELVAATMENAREKIAARRFTEAEKLLNALLEDLPDREEAKKLREHVRLERTNKANYQNGLKALSKNNFFRALTLFTGVKEGSVFYKEALKYHDLAKRKAVKSYTSNGWAEYRLGNNEKALQLAGKSLRLLKNDADAWRLKRAAELKIKKKSAGNGKDRNKTQYTARHLYLIGIDFFKNKQYQKAIGRFKEAIDVDGKYSPAYRGMGAAYASLRRMDEALDAYERYLELHPNAKDAEQIRRLIDDYRAQNR